MGKNLIQQRRGRAKGRYHKPAHKGRGRIKYDNKKQWKGTVTKILHDPLRSAPIAEIHLTDNTKMMVLATEGMTTGTGIESTNDKLQCKQGNILEIGRIPEGYPVYNIEMRPGDGGKLVRAGGSSANIVSHRGNQTVIRLPSGQFKPVDSSCRATIGLPAGGGRREKPFMKAGKKYIAHRKKGKQYPVVRGVAMSAVDHPHGGGNHQHVGKPSTVPRGAPPGRKVGNITSKRTGKR